MPHDVIIVGSGIAGCFLASKLSKAGLKILVLERESDERTAFCGEMTGETTLKRLNISPNSDFVTQQYKNSKLIHLDTNFEINVPRSKGAKLYLLDIQAVKKSLLDSSNAEVRFNTIVKSVIKDKDRVTGVKVKNQNIKGNIVIGADGSSSIVAKTAGFPLESYKTLPSFRYKYKNADIKNPDEALFLIGRELGLGYLWVYPSSRTNVNIGVGAIKNPNMTKVFNKFVAGMKELKKAKVYLRGGDTIPYSGVLPTIAKKGVALVGDSAGQIDSLLGGGIRSSTKAAEILAPHVLNAIDNPNLLLDYDKEYHNSKECRMINKAASHLAKLERMHKKTDIFGLFEDIQETVPSNVLKDAALGRLSWPSMIKYALFHPTLSYRILKALS